MKQNHYSTDDFLKHILDETVFILKHSNQLQYDAYLENEVLQKAFIRSIEIIGEASKKISVEFRKSHPSIDWKAISGTRDILIHEYFGVDHEIIWDVITNEIPFLHQFLIAYFKKEH